MDVIDDLILSTLNKIGCDVEDRQLATLDQDQVFGAISKCLSIACPEFEHKYHHLPKNMGDRFRVGSAFAAKIKDLGYRDDIGFQTILYGNVVEVRRLLMFLIERLPKEHETASAVAVKTSFEKLQKEVGVKVKAGQSAPWTPWFCKRYDYEYSDRLWYPTRTDSCRHFKARPLSLHSDRSTIEQTTSSSVECAASVIENNAMLRHGIQRLEKDIVCLVQASTKPIKPPVAKRKPHIPPKPSPKSLQTETQKLEQQDATQTAVVSNFSRDFNDEVFLLNTIKQLKEDISLEDEKLRSYQTDASHKQTAIATLRDEVNSRTRFTDLLTHIDGSIDKLKEYLNNSEVRSSNLMSQWETHRRQLLSQLESLRLEKSVNTQFEKLQAEIESASNKIDFVEKDIVDKELLLSTLTKEYEAVVAKQSSKVGRNFYTKRILEIVSSVRKQKDEIDKILTDVKVIQKDINFLNGKLDRTYKATDELMFEDAKRDEVLKRGYRNFVNIHEICAEIANDTETSGQVLREIRDLEDKIELESQNEIDKKLEMLVTNLCEIKEENERMTSKLSSQA